MTLNSVIPATCLETSQKVLLVLCTSVVVRFYTFQSRCSGTGGVYVDWNDGYEDQAPKGATHVHGSSHPGGEERTDGWVQSGYEEDLTAGRTHGKAQTSWSHHREDDDKQASYRYREPIVLVFEDTICRHGEPGIVPSGPWRAPGPLPV